jgi:hypothetical protein
MQDLQIGRLREEVRTLLHTQETQRRHYRELEAVYAELQVCWCE